MQYEETGSGREGALLDRRLVQTAVSGLKSEIPVLPLHWVLKSSNKSLCHKAFVRIKGIKTHREQCLIYRKWLVLGLL